MTLIRRLHVGDGLRSEALYSGCETYRYLLRRDWGAGGRRLLFVMLNPSTADEMRNDPTVARCEARARRLGYDGFAVANLFAFRATLPADLRRAADPIGPDNDRILDEAAADAETILCAWGVHGARSGRGLAVFARFHAQGHALWHLGLTKHGLPRHPLYCPNTTELQVWDRPKNP
ncbi:MAG: DUF1643 domain-containing protein [Albidovulum sp.]